MRDVAMAPVRKSNGLDPEFLQEVAGVIKLLGHPDRIRIAEYLLLGEAKVSDIQQWTGLSQPITSQHLRQMKDRNIVDSHREGNCVIYFIANPLVGKMLNCLGETQALMQER